MGENCSRCCQMEESAQKEQTSVAVAPISLASRVTTQGDPKEPPKVPKAASPRASTRGNVLPKPVVVEESPRVTPTVIEEFPSATPIAVNGAVTEELLAQADNKEEKVQQGSRVRGLTAVLRAYVRKLPGKNKGSEDQDGETRIAVSLIREDVVDKKGSAFANIVGRAFVKLKAKQRAEQQQQSRWSDTLAAITGTKEPDSTAAARDGSPSNSGSKWKNAVAAQKSPTRNSSRRNSKNEDIDTTKRLDEMPNGAIGVHQRLDGALVPSQQQQSKWNDTLAAIKKGSKGPDSAPALNGSSSNSSSKWKDAVAAQKSTTRNSSRRNSRRGPHEDINTTDSLDDELLNGTLQVQQRLDGALVLKHTVCHGHQAGEGTAKVFAKKT
eukprot:gnl/TRDRNA2_/TRDRNA2_58922_c0_seq1.p1 gnl/TRDRNA2_/TRDRNA2_58922_c0~~gnl/TRDRNA2_/TRDRNA2_58922_c0_seq1.p1  ORF type:complete len:382 (-),score=68.05 gnl/TRDRNA2_/TRDRNA2_58922_c0_seq1:120-1265(-)